MDRSSEAKPTLEALEEERRRLKQLERNLAAERDRVQASAAKEITRMQEALRDAAGRAARRERELESTRKRLERKMDGGRFGRLTGLLRRRLGPEEQREGGGQSEAVEVLARELAEREAELERKVDELVDAERRSVEQLAARRAALQQREVALQATQPVRVAPDPLADRATVLDEREADLAETIAALEQRGRELALLRDGLEQERSLLTGRWRRLAEAEKAAPVRTAFRPRVGFSEGLRDLARKRGAQ